MNWISKLKFQLFYHNSTVFSAPEKVTFCGINQTLIFQFQNIILYKNNNKINELCLSAAQIELPLKACRRFQVFLYKRINSIHCITRTSKELAFKRVSEDNLLRRIDIIFTNVCQLLYFHLIGFWSLLSDLI